MACYKCTSAAQRVVQEVISEAPAGKADEGAKQSAQGPHGLLLRMGWSPGPQGGWAVKVETVHWQTGCLGASHSLIRLQLQVYGEEQVEKAATLGVGPRQHWWGVARSAALVC